MIFTYFTTLELVLIAILWIAYGSFAASRTKFHCQENDKHGIILAMIVFAPVVFVYRAFRGVISREYEQD